MPAPPPPGYASSDDKTWALVAHFGGALGSFLCCGVLGFVGPLVAFLVKGNTSPIARQHAVNALNFQIIWSGLSIVLYIISIAAGVGAGVSFTAAGIGVLFLLLRILIWIFTTAMAVIAGIKATNGQLWKYPASFPIIK
jgi:uncharacterized protein